MEERRNKTTLAMDCAARGYGTDSMRRQSDGEGGFGGAATCSLAAQLLAQHGLLLCWMPAGPGVLLNCQVQSDQSQ